ncbi:MAG: tRNA lysidine(34) synthetase TilS [Ahrensia sp.]|nr:tRNA lysidine(34) synthetase TilS [Ahrensia sp.]
MLNAERLADTKSVTCSELLSDIKFSPNKKVIVALSGGSDSLAMAVFLKQYLAAHYPHMDFVAVTVDHGLRPESSAEAVSVGKQCQALGINHEIVRWDGEKPTTGIQRAAREARYALLYAAAKRHHTNLVFTGHTLDDNLETIAMRMARTSPDKPVSGISKFTLYRNEIWFVRPLLGLRKQELRDNLRTRGISWIDDPSNLDVRFERVRVRLSDVFDTAQVIIADAVANNPSAVCELLSDDRLVDFSNWRSEVRIARKTISHSGFYGTLRILLSMVGKTNYLPVLSRTAPELSPVADIEILFRTAFNKTKYTIGGCLLVLDGDFVVIVREQRNKGLGVFGFDYILPDHAFDVAQVLRRRQGLPDLPPIPINDAAC